MGTKGGCAAFFFFLPFGLQDGLGLCEVEDGCGGEGGEDELDLGYGI